MGLEILYNDKVVETLPDATLDMEEEVFYFPLHDSNRSGKLMSADNLSGYMIQVDELFYDILSSYYSTFFNGDGGFTTPNLCYKIKMNKAKSRAAKLKGLL